jgi:hypothetical protein
LNGKEENVTALLKKVRPNALSKPTGTAKAVRLVGSPASNEGLFKIEPRRFGREGVHWCRWEMSVPSDWTKENLVEPERWASVARLLHRADRISFTSDDLRFIGELIVVEADPQRHFAQVQILSYRELEPVNLQNAEVDGFRVVDGGLTEKFKVVRVSDQHVVRSGFPTAFDAERFIRTDMQSVVI